MRLTANEGADASRRVPTTCGIVFGALRTGEIFSQAFLASSGSTRRQKKAKLARGLRPALRQRSRLEPRRHRDRWRRQGWKGM